MNLSKENSVQSLIFSLHFDNFRRGGGGTWLFCIKFIISIFFSFVQCTSLLAQICNLMKTKIISPFAFPLTPTIFGSPLASNPYSLLSLECIRIFPYQTRLRYFQSRNFLVILLFSYAEIHYQNNSLKSFTITC